MKSLNRPDTLIFISGDELLPYFDVAMQSLLPAVPDISKPMVYLHFEENNSEQWRHRFHCFERPYYDLGLQAAAMMKEIFYHKKQNLDYYQASQTCLSATFVPAL